MSEKTLLQRAGRILRELLFVGLLALVLFSARSSLADHYVVPTSSMEYTLMPGDRVLVNKLAYGLRVPFTGWQLTDGASPRRGEVVVFDSPETGKRLIKRVVAIGGDTVEVRRDQHLYLNGESTAIAPGEWTEQIGDREVELNLSNGGGSSAYGPVTIPPGQVLVMGDFRGNSHDGRWFGTIDEDEIYGRGVAVFLRSGDGFVWLPL